MKLFKTIGTVADSAASATTEIFSGLEHGAGAISLAMVEVRLDMAKDLRDKYKDNEVSSLINYSKKITASNWSGPASKAKSQ